MGTRGGPEEDHMLTAPVRRISQIACPAIFLFSPCTTSLSQSFAPSPKPAEDTALVICLSTESESGWRQVTAQQCSVSGVRWVDLIIGAVVLGAVLLGTARQKLISLRPKERRSP
jgi:hypothetical protein